VTESFSSAVIECAGEEWSGFCRWVRLVERCGALCFAGSWQRDIPGDARLYLKC